jgi:predicted HTH transcriptional regulator
MKPEVLRELVAQPESEELEFKSRLPDTGHLAALISAFANTNGGRLVVGVRDDGSIVGLDDVDRAHLRIEQALKAVSPSVQIETETISIDGKSVLVVTIPKGRQSPYLVAGRVLQRLGDRIMPITSQRLYSGITERAKSLDDLRAEVERLSKTIETLNSELIAARSWKTKGFDMVLGGIIGAAISLFISLALGL